MKKHVQTFDFSGSYDPIKIEHGLGTTGILVQVWNNDRLVPDAAVKTEDDNVAWLDLTKGSYDGKAFRVVVIG